MPFETVSQCHCEEPQATKQSRKASKLRGLPRSLWSLAMTGMDCDTASVGVDSLLTEVIIAEKIIATQ
jgi:hypothetical protein